MHKCSLSLLVFLAACEPPKPPPTPGPLRAGVATVRLDSPLGISLGGFGRTKHDDEPGSPFADKLPASRGIQTAPTARAVALSDDLTTTIIVRLELCLTPATLRHRAQALLHERGIDAPLIVSSTHTHGGPARYLHPAPVEGSAGVDTTSLAMDFFSAQQEERLALTIADAAQQALTDLRPASVGSATADLGNFNDDRRCENDDLYGAGYKDSQLTVIRIDEVDGAGQPVKPITAFLHFAVHGTMLGGSNSLISTDAPGAMELYASDTLGVPLVFLQGSAGDVSPHRGNPVLADFQALEHFGRTAAPLIAEAFARAAPHERPAHARLQRFELPIDLSRAALGYERGEFGEFGGIGCGLGSKGCPATPSTKKDLLCLPLAHRPFSQTSVVALRLEDLLVVSLPGEPTTAIAARVKKLGAGLDVTQTLVLGYAQDHVGYILEEPDFMRMGYEPTVSPWGWRLGDFLVDKSAEAIAGLGKSSPALAQPPPGLEGPRSADNSLRNPMQVDVIPTIDRLQTAMFRFAGGDPSLGTPEVTLERAAEGRFEPVKASATRVVNSGPELVLREDAMPLFAVEPAATTRDHVWTVEWETLPDLPEGTYRFVARGQAKVAGTVNVFTLTSNAFDVHVSHAVATGEATLDAAGTLKVVSRFPPNPSRRGPNGDVLGNYRLRSLTGNPLLGVALEGGTATATLTYPDATTQTVSLTWSEGALTGTAKPMAGTTRVAIATGALVDRAGNTNGAPLMLSVRR